MIMTWVWTGMVCIAVLCGLATGRGEAVSAAALEGAQAGLELAISIGGMLCLWSGVMAVMERSGLAAGLGRRMEPLLRLLFPEGSRDGETRACIAANFSANLLGLGNAATPLGIKATRHLARHHPGSASDDMCMLVVCNTASMQLLPTTVAAIRAAQGSARPFEILPAVWLSSLISVSVGVLVCRLLSRFWRE